jgi:DNA polymerase III epsilon subunit-like protein
MILFFDTETTGKANFKLEPDDLSQPRLVQLGAILTDDEGKEISSVNLIVRPKGFDIPDAAASIHGITTTLANQVGVPIVRVLHVFHQLASAAKCFAAHNIDFDEFILKGEFLRAKFTSTPFETDKDFFCTMKGMTDVCQLPGPYRFKWPTLQEAHQHAFGREFKGEHDAMADVRACLALHFWLRKQVSE